MLKWFKNEKSRVLYKESLIEGQTSKIECQLLFDLARGVDEGCIIEIGSFRGKSTIALAKGVLAGNPSIPLFAIDPHENFSGVLGGEFGPQDRKAFFRNVLDAGVVEVVRLVNLSSEIVSQNWNQKVGFLWIDGDHSYEGVKRDFLCWEKHLLSNAKIAFHDSTDSRLGPHQFLKELLAERPYKKIQTLDLTTVIQKIGD